MLGGVRVPATSLADILDRLHNQTTGVFGVNFLMPFLDKQCIEVAASKARVVEFFYGDPDPDLVKLVHTGGALAAGKSGPSTRPGRLGMLAAT
jgi:hypothetical protein